MNFSIFNFTSKNEGLTKLKEAVNLRNQMGGALHWNMVNDDCIEIANRLKDMGVLRSEIENILGGEGYA